MFKVSERSLNRTLSPLMNSKGKSITFPYSIPDKNITYNHFFTEKHFSMIDFFSSSFMNYYSKLISGDEEFKLSPYDERIVKRGMAIFSVNKRFTPVVGDRCIEIHQADGINSSLKITASEIQKSNFGKFTIQEIDHVIQDFSTYPISIDMPVRYLDYNFKKYTFEKCSVNSRLIHLKSRTESRGSDERLVNVEYEIEFTTELGQMFISNLCMINVDSIPDNFYNLSKYAQCLYRRFIIHVLRLNHSNNPIFLSMDRIKKELNIVNHNVTTTKKTISNWLDEMTPGIINSWSYDKTKKMFTVVRNQHQNLCKSTSKSM